jgi:hypothetical protein
MRFYLSIVVLILGGLPLPQAHAEPPSPKCLITKEIFDNSYNPKIWAWVGENQCPKCLNSCDCGTKEEMAVESCIVGEYGGQSKACDKCSKEISTHPACKFLVDLGKQSVGYDFLSQYLASDACVIPYDVSFGISKSPSYQ